MIIRIKGKAIRGDLVKSIVVRSDMSPIPVTLEATIREDKSIANLFLEGKLLSVGNYEFQIIKVKSSKNRSAQGVHEINSISVIAFLSSCAKVAFVSPVPIIRKNTSLSSIFFSSGATCKTFKNDFKVPRIAILKGDTPSFHITQALREQGGILRWKNGGMEFMRYSDIFNQKEAMILPNNATDDVVSEFEQRHKIESFYSISKNGSLSNGNNKKARKVSFSPFKSPFEMNGMTESLVRRKVINTALSMNLTAGDIVGIKGSKPLSIGTSASVHISGTDGSEIKQYTRLWLYEKQN